MRFTFECPACKNIFHVTHRDLAHGGQALRCLCGNTPAPDILTAYQNIGKTMVELYDCCAGGQKGWLPQEIKHTP
jgi:predicted Zn finger-like uncharacterized protein